MSYPSRAVLPDNIYPDHLPPVDVPLFRGGHCGYDVWHKTHASHLDPNKTPPRPIIIDCDPGLDDAVALMLACAHPKRLDIKLVTTVCGNNNVDQLTNNALRLLYLLGCSHIAVAQGAAKPLQSSLVTAECVHGADGLAGVKIPNSPASALGDDAVTAMAKVVHDCSEITLVATGPLTNIAVFLQQYPHLKPKITQIVSMGGAVFGGNISPVAEFNYHCDPESADIVLRSGIPMAMFGLDVTVRAKFHQYHIDSLLSPTNSNNPVARVFHYLTQYCFDRELPHFLYADREHGMNMHDVTCIAYLLRPELFTLKPCHVAMELQGQYTRGQTVVDFLDLTTEPHNVDVAFRLDADAFRKLIFDAVASYA